MIRSELAQQTWDRLEHALNAYKDGRLTRRECLLCLAQLITPENVAAVLTGPPWLPEHLDEELVRWSLDGPVGDEVVVGGELSSKQAELIAQRLRVARQAIQGWMNQQPRTNGASQRGPAPGAGWLTRKDDGTVEWRQGDIRLNMALPAEAWIATLGYGFLERAILRDHPRYPCTTPALRAEIEQALVPGSRGRGALRDPSASKLDAIAQALVEAARKADSVGIALLHVMRRITTSTFSYDDFLGDLGGSYRHGNLGQRLKKSHFDYRYVALPQAAPPASLLSSLREETGNWTQFKAGYRAYLTEPIIAEVTAWALSAAARGLLPVLLCCEPFVACFDQLSGPEKNAFGCHRFLLYDVILQRLQGIGLTVRGQHLNPSQVRRHRAELSPNLSRPTGRSSS